MKPPVIIWFRQDLRLSDNPAYHDACAMGHPVLPIYILDDVNAGEWKMGGASRAWLHHSLTALSKSMGGHLQVYQGDAQSVLTQLIKTTGTKDIFWNRCYEPWRIARDKQIKEYFSNHNVVCHSTNGSLLWEPWTIQKGDGTPYRVFTPFFRNGCMKAETPRLPLPAPKPPAFYKTDSINLIDGLSLLPNTLNWNQSMMTHWQVGEDAAQKRLDSFLSNGIKNYKDGRNYPSQRSVSRLSPHLHFGEISPNQAWHAAMDIAVPQRAETDVDTFCSELGWREFSHSLLYFNPTLPEKSLNPRFADFDWAGVDHEMLDRWHKGETGYPLVDAGMRELWATGYMHNRVRMVVGSFLVKNLRYHWRNGEDWFWDTLVDADLANNSASWQWIGGTGADAAPYFRIFNPVTQGEKFDPDGTYINQWAPDSHKIKPILDHKTSRDAALEAFKAMK